MDTTREGYFGMSNRSVKPRIRTLTARIRPAAIWVCAAVITQLTVRIAAAHDGNAQALPGAAVIFVENETGSERGNAPTGPAAALTLSELEQLALQHHPALVRAEALVGAAQGGRLQAGLPPNPSIGYEGQQLGSGGRAEQHGVFIEQEFRLGGKRQLDETVAARGVALARGDWEIRRREILTELHIAFHEAAVAMRHVQLAEDLVKISSEIERSVAALYQAQEVSRAAWLESRLETESARLMARKAEERYLAARRKLAAAVGIPELPPRPLQAEPDDLPEPQEFEDIWRRIQASSPELVRASRAVEHARAVLRRACAEAVPNLSVRGLVNVIDNGVEGTTNGGIAVSLPLPIVNRNQGAVMQARYELSAAENAVRELELDLRGRLAEVYARYRDARAEAERYRSTILPTAAEVLDLTRKSYQAGEASFADLLLAERSYVQKQAEYLEALLRFRTAEAEMAGDLVKVSSTSP